ncbi:MAG: molybdate ABC transporter substrate-binding protein [Microbacteriaceae bacterium]|nr:molybdate ABC transporter substrate-binding protein [Microbacteriaceae bacterium]
MRARRRPRLPLVGALALAAATLLTACGAVAPAEPGPAATGDGGVGPSGELTVHAAASLHEAFAELADEFMAAHPGTAITVSTGGSSGLVAQLREGAPGDVLATADERTMAQAVEEGLIAGETPVFATNTLAIVTEPGNPKGIAGLADLAAADVRLVVCAEQVPCGAATARLEAAAGVELRPVSEEHAVTDVLGKVVAGQADAGLVYRTDAVGAGDAVAIVEMPEAAGIVNAYPIGVTANAANPALARAWIEFVLAEPAQSRLQHDHGFGAP